jgi:hypothetical protein
LCNCVYCTVYMYCIKMFKRTNNYDFAIECLDTKGQNIEKLNL